MLPSSRCCVVVVAILCWRSCQALDNNTSAVLGRATASRHHSHRHPAPPPERPDGGTDSTAGNDWARDMLSSRSIVFLGDSLTRYQYLSLAAFADYGEWPGDSDTFCPPGAPEPCPNPVFHEYFKDNGSKQMWNLFSRKSSALLRGRETCDCFRDRRHPERTIENRYYHNPSSNTTLTYIKWFGVVSEPAGHILPTDVRRGLPPGVPWDSQRATQLLGCEAGKCGHPAAWRLSPGQTLAQHIAALGPDVVVVNNGAWKQDPSTEHWLEIAKAGEHLRAHGRLVLWKASMSLKACSNERKAPFGAKMPAELAATGKWTEYDASRTVCGAVSERAREEVFQRDGLHLKGDTYRQLNLQLLRLMAEDSATRADD